MKFATLKVSTRLALGFGTSILLGTAIAVTGMVQMRHLASMVDELANDRMPKVDMLSDFKDNLNVIARASRNVIILKDPALQASERKVIADTRAQNTKLLETLAKEIVLPQGRELLKTIQDGRSGYNEAVDRAMALATQGKAEEAGLLLIGEVRQKQNVLFKAVDDSTKMQAGIATRLGADSMDLASSSAASMMAMAGAMALIGGLAGWALSRSLGRALGAEPADLSTAVQRVADGDLATPVSVRANDTTSTMAAVARMQHSLSKIVGSVRSNSESVSTASAEIAQGNQDLSSRTEQQASSLEETAASMEQISATAKQNSDSAAQATQLALNANQVARDGGVIVGEVVQTMQQIDQASKKIVDIISVIDGIAFQTNILALNAAVEAARAGEQGRGFAVVAGEVRTLAQRSAEAAKEIKTLIGASVVCVEQGTALVGRAGTNMTDIVASIQRVNDIVEEIACASREQTAGVAQVSEAVSQMDQVTQQNAALVEESAAAAESLRQQAEALVSTVSVFRVAGVQQAVVSSTHKAYVQENQQRSVAVRRTVGAAPTPARSPVKSRRPAEIPALASAGGDWASF